jgi:hypothetical protein
MKIELTPRQLVRLLDTARHIDEKWPRIWRPSSATKSHAVLIKRRKAKNSQIVPSQRRGWSKISDLVRSVF